MGVIFLLADDRLSGIKKQTENNNKTASACVLSFIGTTSPFRYGFHGPFVLLHGDLQLPVLQVNPHQAAVLPFVHVQQVCAVLVSLKDVLQARLEVQRRHGGIPDDLQQHVLLHLQALLPRRDDGAVSALSLHKHPLQLLQSGRGPPVPSALFLQGVVQRGRCGAGLHQPLLLVVQRLSLLLKGRE